MRPVIASIGRVPKSLDEAPVSQRLLAQVDPGVRERNLSEAIEMLAKYADKNPSQKEAWAARVDAALLVILGLRGDVGRRLWLASSVEQVALQLSDKPTAAQIDQAATSVLVLFATAYPSLGLIRGIDRNCLRTALRLRCTRPARFWVAMCDLAAKSGLGRVPPTSYAKEFAKYRQLLPGLPG